MSVEFNEENDFNRSYDQSVNRISNSDGLTAWIIKKGWAKNESQANTIMIIVAIICFAVAIFFAIR
jgi:hypothetical protein